MVSIRLSDDEFRKLHEVCETTGARSISDLARGAMQKMMGDGDGVGERLRVLDQRVTKLQKEMTRLTSLVGACEEGGR